MTLQQHIFNLSVRLPEWLLLQLISILSAYPTMEALTKNKITALIATCNPA